ncbi:MAG: hypothetical protein ABEK01_00085 [Candidatus Nanohaloarchaea archaeon]
MRQGQASLEFFFMIGLSALMMAILLGIVAQKQSAVNEMRNQKIGDEVAETIAFNVEMALVQGNGYSRKFYIARSIAGRTYNISVANSTVYVGWGGSFATEDTFYEGRSIEFSTEDFSRLKVVNNRTGGSNRVFIVGQ